MIQPGVTPGLNAAASPSIPFFLGKRQPPAQRNSRVDPLPGINQLLQLLPGDKGIIGIEGHAAIQFGHPARISTSRRPRRLGSSQARSPAHSEQSRFRARKAALRHQSIRRRGRSAISTTSIQACTVWRAAPNARTASPQGERASAVASGSIDHVNSDKSLERSGTCSSRLRLTPSSTRQSWSPPATPADLRAQDVRLEQQIGQQLPHGFLQQRNTIAAAVRGPVAQSPAPGLSALPAVPDADR